MTDKKFKIVSCTKKSKEELDKIGLGYTWQNQQENSVNMTCKIIKEICNDIKIQNLFAGITEKRSLMFYCEMKLGWAKEEYKYLAYKRIVVNCTNVGNLKKK
jgi:3-deoxy-D-manno-octulosonate 8-phosphate phosphatase KdsC-like HAD superfamily phosphatase